LTSLVDEKIQAIDIDKWTVKLGDRSFAVRDQVDRVVKVVIAVKDFVSAQVSAEPHAAVAWAGVCILLPVSLGIISISPSI
jgi:hypothetical protein